MRLMEFFLLDVEKEEQLKINLNKILLKLLIEIF